MSRELMMKECFMKKEIAIKDVIKEMLHQNFKGTKY